MGSSVCQTPTVSRCWTLANEVETDAAKSSVRAVYCGHNFVFNVVCDSLAKFFGASCHLMQVLLATTLNGHWRLTVLLSKHCTTTYVLFISLVTLQGESGRREGEGRRHGVSPSSSTADLVSKFLTELQIAKAQSNQFLSQILLTLPLLKCGSFAPPKNFLKS